MKPTQKKSPSSCALETLEARNLFASISPVSTDLFTGLRTVTVTGDGTNDAWTINHNGNGRVSISGPFDATRNDVQQLIVRTNGGADTVKYNLTGNNVAGFVLDIDTGDDNGANIVGTDDTVTVNLNGNINRSLKINVQTRSFNDRININADRDNLATGVRVASGRTLEMNLGAGDNNDTIDVSYRGDMDGKLKIAASGDGGGGIFNGNDTIKAKVVMDENSGQLSTGQSGIGALDMKLEGNGGTDTMTALLGDHSGGNVHIDQARVTSGAFLFSTLLPPADKVIHSVNVEVEGFQPDGDHDILVSAP